MTNMQAAIGVAQLERMDEFVKKKRRIGQMYNELLADVKGIQLNLARTDYAESIYWVYGIVLKDEIPFDAEEAMKRLHNVGVGSRPFFGPCMSSLFSKKWGCLKMRDILLQKI